MKLSAFLLAVLCTAIGKAQPFAVNDNIPAVTLNNVLNYNSPSFSIAEYKDKLLILDFMSTGCISCIRALPRFDSLQLQFKPALQIVLVTSDTKQRVISFLKNNRLGRELRFPIIAEDSLLEKWFPHQFISHEAWIYKGKVIAITGAEYVNEKNVQVALSGKPLHLPVKNDITTYDYSQPLFVFNQALSQYSEAALQYTAGFRSSLPGVTRRFVHTVDSASATQRILFINYPLLDIYLRSYGLPLYYPRKYIKLDGVNRDKFIYAQGYREQWNLDNTFCYEAILPMSLPPPQCWEKVRTDINTYFNLQTRIEKRDTTYLIITQTNYSNH
ncbi:MAG TPA: hypothetical protein VHD35_02260 [Chitinophagaceae bacterium]|nr:hypothetical protein [Chitinophagaceae bacterium]